MLFQVETLETGFKVLCKQSNMVGYENKKQKKKENSKCIIYFTPFLTKSKNIK